MKGGEHGAVIIPGKADNSRLYRLIARRDEPRMPLGGGSLTDEQIVTIKAWIDEGEAWDAAPPPAVTSAYRLRGPRRAPHRRRGIADSPNRRVNARRRNHGLFHELDYFTNSIISLTPPYRPPLWIRHIHRSGGLLR